MKGQGQNEGTPYLVETGDSNRTTVRFSEIYSSIGYPAMGIGTGNYTSHRNNLHHLSDSHRVNLSGDASSDSTFVAIEGNYVHDTIMWNPDPDMARKDNKTHSDSLVQLEGGSNVRIVGNRSTGLHSTDGTSSVLRTTSTQPFIPVLTGGILYDVSTSSIMVSPNAGWTVKSVKIDRNWLGGGEVTINGTEDLLNGSSITNNLFDKNSLQDMPIWPKAPSGVSMSGNTYTDGSGF